MQPRAGQVPLPAYRGGRNPQSLCRALDAQAGKKTQFNNARLLGVELSKALQRRIDGDYVPVLSADWRDRFLKGEKCGAAPPLQRLPFARVANQNPPHRMGRGSEELVPVLEIRTPLVDQLEIDLVD